LAKRLSGGWTPLIRRTWQAYRRYGWQNIKAKVVGLRGYQTPPQIRPYHIAATNGHRVASHRLLYLDWGIPKPDQDAASVTAKLLMQTIGSLGYKVTFVPCNLKYEPGYYEDLVADDVEVIVYPAVHSVYEWLKENAGRFDICIMARGPVVWPFLSILEKVAPNLKLIFNTVDLHYLRVMRQAELENDDKVGQAAVQARDQEFDLIKKCHYTIVLSTDEAYAVREVNPEASIVVLPLVFEDIPGSAKPYCERRDILFIGSFPHQPNIDAVTFFVEQVFPLIRTRIPDLRFRIIGANPPDSIQRLGRIEGVEVLGFVKDLERVFSNIRLSVAPLRYGAGIKGKIGTSFCYGVPCVGTSIAVEGMGLVTGKNVLIGETPSALADAVCEAYLNEECWNTLSTEGHRFALDNYSVSVIRGQVRNLFDAVIEGWQPIHSAVELDSWDAFQRHVNRCQGEYERRVLREQALLPSAHTGSFTTPGFCCVCARETWFLTSFMYSTGKTPDGRPMPNWREYMRCEHCGLVNRTRAALNALYTLASLQKHSRIYITEKLTQTYCWLEARCSNLQGSEFFGNTYEPGFIVDGIRHENVMNLSFKDHAFDRILSFDVLEHVPDPERAFLELYRVLDENGVLIFSVPFLTSSRTDVIRATMHSNGEIEHHLPPEYHGNPVDPEKGALCFRYFGWEVLDRLKRCGFKKVRCIAYWSENQGYLGREQYLFLAVK